MRRLINLATCILMLCFLAIFISRLIGSLAPKTSLADAVRRDTQLTDGIWCWQRICPGTTPISTAKDAILQSGGKLVVDSPHQLEAEYSMGYAVVITDLGEDAPIAAILIGPSSTQATAISLADVVVSFGSPRLLEYNEVTGTKFICFQSYLCASLFDDASRSLFSSRRIDFDLKVGSIDFFNEATLPHVDFQPWKGFTLLRSQ